MDIILPLVGQTSIFHSEIDDASRFTPTIDPADEKLTVL
jgi:hypothetical protein